MNKNRDARTRSFISELKEGFAIVLDPEDGDVYLYPFKPLVSFPQLLAQVP
jgi:hypothetical protein